jgi:2-polyprenyl-3-methyl-5-hydroxy-6-metoxy-1,4-benzoquinol methylase
MKCRHCMTELTLSLVDLGSAPPSNAYLGQAQLRAPEKAFPLTVMVCERCWLVQTLDFTQADELFSADYAYFSSFSTSWMEHAERYVGQMVRRFGLGRDATIVEVASNDGYLLQYVKALGMRCLGVEPTASTARAAREKGIDTLEVFFGETQGSALAKQGWQADLAIANNVLAHVPDINDFMRGFARLLNPHGVSTFEFPHLLQLLRENQFDTIYHEHYSYLSLVAVSRIAEQAGLQVFDVEVLPTHGGSLRLFVQRADTGIRAISPAVLEMLQLETEAGLTSPDGYAGFQTRAENVKDDFVTFLIDAKRQGKRVAAYGAAAKGNTLMNFAGIRPDLIRYVVDRNPAKQNRFMPGSRIPIVAEEKLDADRPDYIVILPWNLKDEVMQQLDRARDWGARFVTVVPALEIA